MRLLAATAVLLVVLAGCANGPAPPTSSPSSSPEPWDTRSYSPSAFRLTSSSFNEGQPIPRKHTCDGAETSPPLTFLGVPQGAKSLALTVRDHDVPTPEAPAGIIDHWAVWNVTVGLRATSATFPEGGVPAGAQEGRNDFGHGWLGPCPPQGASPHRYNFTAYALDFKPPLGANATADELDAAIVGHVLARWTLTGTYGRPLNVTATATSSTTNSTSP